MRVTRDRLAMDDERGAAALVVGITVVALIGFAAFAVDLGGLWEDRRHVVNASDAAALAAAQEYATGGDGCAGVDDEYTVANDPEAEVESCEPGVLLPTQGYVTVTARAPVDYSFASILDIPDDTVSSTTTASYRIAQSVAGLRPFGLCASIAEQMRLAASGTRHRVYYDKDRQLAEGGVLPCAENPEGNWALIDLDDQPPGSGGTPSNSDLKEWTRNGCPCSVSARPIGGDTGAFGGSLADPLSEIRSTVGDEQVFCLPVYDGTTGQGANSEFALSGFAAVALWDFQATGAQEDRFLELSIEDPGVCSPGESGELGAVDFGARTLHICAVDFADDRSQCLAP